MGPPPRPPQVGYELKDEIERKFDKWQEPPPVKQVKPLPAPLDGQRKKRGGRRWGPGTSRAGTEWEGKRLAPSQLTPCPVPRYRKMKERLGLTEIRKQANRMSFGEIGRAHV